MSKIKTTGELREFLSAMLLGVKNGDLSDDKARNITKMAAQINESFYAEVKIYKTRLEAGIASESLGLLPLNLPDKKI